MANALSAETMSQLGPALRRKAQAVARQTNSPPSVEGLVEFALTQNFCVGTDPRQVYEFVEAWLNGYEPPENSADVQELAMATA